MEGTYKRRLIDYLKRNLKKSYPAATLKVALINQGYLRAMVDEALEQAIKEMAKEAPILKENPQIEHEVIAEQPTSKKSWWRRLLGL